MTLPFATNRYGDLLREFYQGIKNNNLSEVRMDEIQRVFNELWMDFQNRNYHPKINQPEIYQPAFSSSPLNVFHCYVTTDFNTVINTMTPITFERSSGDNFVFDFWEEDKSKIRVDRSKFNVSIDGFVAWESNTIGDRIIALFVYDQDDVQIASTEISNVPTSNSALFGLKQNFAYTEDIRGIFPNVAYMILKVFQNGANPLKVETAVLSVKIA